MHSKSYLSEYFHTAITNKMYTVFFVYQRLILTDFVFQKVLHGPNLLTYKVYRAKFVEQFIAETFQTSKVNKQ